MKMESERERMRSAFECDTEYNSMKSWQAESELKFTTFDAIDRRNGWWKVTLEWMLLTGLVTEYELIEMGELG